MVSINLIPEAVQRTQKWHRHLAIWTVMVLGALVMLTLPLAMGWIRQSEENRLSRQNDLMQSGLFAERTRLRSLEFSAKDALLCLERAKALRSKRAWSSVVSAIAEELPAGCWLTSIASDPSVPPPASKRADTAPVKKASTKKATTPSAVTIDAPRKILLTGYATEPSEPYQFVINLKETGLFLDVAMVTSRREPVLDSSYFRFELTCDW